MPRFRFSMSRLLLIVLLVALGCAALVQSTPLWASVVVTITLLLLMLSAIMAITGRGSSRSFWIGFAVAGWIYWIVVNTQFTADFRGRLLTTQSLDYLARKVQKQGFQPSSAPPPYYPPAAVAPPTQIAPQRVTVAPPTVYYSQPVSTTVYTVVAPTGTGHFERLMAFDRIGQAMYVILFGLLGGSVCRWRGDRLEHSATVAPRFSD